MKKTSAIIIICTIVCLVFVSTGFAQDKLSKKPLETSPKIKMRVRAKGDFVGKVVGIDTSNKTISVKNKGILVTFDIASPRLIGYKGLDQIKTGDSISVGYTGDGIIISRFTGKIPVMPTGPAQTKKTTSVSKKGSFTSIKERYNSAAFNDVDHNEDGKISPAELSSIIHGLTMEQFRKYDKNGDGSLDRKEYGAIR